MRIGEVKIPPECKKVVIEREENRVVLILEPENYGDKLFKETGRVESIPDIGDLAIFWDEGHESEAAIGILTDYDLPKQFIEKAYKSNNGNWTKFAVKFRDYAQYDAILKYKAHVSKEE